MEHIPQVRYVNLYSYSFVFLGRTLTVFPYKILIFWLLRNLSTIVCTGTKTGVLGPPVSRLMLDEGKHTSPFHTRKTDAAFWLQCLLKQLQYAIRVYWLRIDLSKGWYYLLVHDRNQQVWNITQTLFATADKSYLFLEILPLTHNDSA